MSQEQPELSTKILTPQTGVKLWKNPKNKFLVFELHYTADETKRSDEFKADKRASLSYRKYMMEYELSWESWAGLPVYGDTYSDHHHLTQETMWPVAGLPLFRGWDFGLTPACVVCQMVEDEFRVIKEFTAMNMGAQRFSEIVLKECIKLYPTRADWKRHWVDVIDPSGQYRKDTDEGTCAKILDDQGLSVVPGAEPFEERRNSVEHYLRRFTKAGSCFKISAVDCPVLVRGFKGGYQYPERSAEIEPGKLRPIKNEYSHPHDGLQMVTSYLVKNRPGYSGLIKSPSYGFLR